MQISGGQLFSKLDMLQAYQQPTVDGDGILVVNAPRELFRYTKTAIWSVSGSNDLSMCNGLDSAGIACSYNAIVII